MLKWGRRSRAAPWAVAGRYRTFMPYEIAFVGCGQMGFAVLWGAVKAKVIRPEQCLVVDPDADRRERAEALGCAVSESTSEAAQASTIVLAVKPQSFADVAAALGVLTNDTLVLSVMAGIRSSSIRDALGGKCRVVRMMPNTPCQIGAGMAAIALGAGADRGDGLLARALFEPISAVIEIDEKHLHAVTAVSGSGPAYVFLLAEVMQQAATQLGIPDDAARTLVTQTILGAAKLLDQSEHTPAELREAVTSPAGTTAAALKVMFDRKLPQTVIDAITAARDRGQELDKP